MLKNSKYDYLEGEAKFIEKRNVSKYCTGIEECDDMMIKLQK